MQCPVPATERERGSTKAQGCVCVGTGTKKIGEGCWNGYGGGIEAGESEVDAAIRELQEESGALTQPEHLEKIVPIFFSEHIGIIKSRILDFSKNQNF